MQICARKGCGNSWPVPMKKRGGSPKVYCSMACGRAAYEAKPERRAYMAAYMAAYEARPKRRAYQAQRRRDARRLAYNSLYLAIQRCHSTACPSFEDYGEKGIAVHERYRDGMRALTANLIADIGLPDPKTGRIELDRYPNGDGGYEPGNLRWATRRENVLNRCTTRWLTFEGRTLCLADWAREVGISPNLLGHRLKLGWPLARALTPPRPYTKKDQSNVEP